MSKNDKLISRFLSFPKDFTYDELVKLLGIFKFYELATGKTTGSAVKFMNNDFPENLIMFHKPHPSNIIKMYVLKNVYQTLIGCGFELVKPTKKKEENEKND
ncbi:MAG: type II toxin-antitoxin system HicA family toxin [Dysgonomonas sp.]